MEAVIPSNKWAEIHLDLLHEIIRHIDSYGDYIRLCFVCKSWNMELPKVSQHKKHLLLMLPFDNESDITRPFYHVGERKVTHRLNLQETRNAMTRGSSHGWLTSVGLDGSLRMLKPLTGAQIHLPPLSTFPDMIGHKNEEYTMICSIHGNIYTEDIFHLQKAHIDKIVLSSPPDDDDKDFMAVAIYGGFCRLAYCTRDDNKWRDFTIPEARPCYCDVIFHEGKIYALDWWGYIYEYDMKTKVGEKSSALPCCGEYHDQGRYLVGIPGGLLMLLRHYDYNHKQLFPDESLYRTCGFSIYKLNQYEWIEIKSLDDYVIVVGFNSSICMLPHTISHTRGNYIYYSDNHAERHYTQVIGGHDIGVFDLETRVAHNFFPDAHIISPAPIWLFYESISAKF